MKNKYQRLFTIGIIWHTYKMVRNDTSIIAIRINDL